MSFSDTQSFLSDARAVYVQAYKLETYDDAQYDVYVMAEIEYTSEGAAVDGVRQARTETAKTYMKVPVRVLAKSQYVVVDYPVFVAEPDSSVYAGTQFMGREADKAVNEQIAQVLTNFFAAYYEENQTRIEYFLSTSADKEKFKGLNGRYDFSEIKSVRSYLDPVDARRILSVVELRIADVNGQALTQRYNMLVTHDGTRYYVVDMDTKTVDISKYNFNVQ
jgi:hypothetical protein